jgi:N-acetylglucosamine-6-phosphate deacetylase
MESNSEIVEVKEMKAIVNGKIILPTEVVEGKVLVFGKKVQGLMDQAPMEAEVIDAKGAYVSPGFVDVHIHGSGGHDTMEGSREALEAMSRKVIADGVTSFLPTTMTMDKEAVRAAFAAIRSAMDNDLSGARAIGVNMEGPFISMAKKGAQNPDYVVKPDWSYIKGYEDIIKLMTIAPEEDEGQAFIKKVKEKTDIRLSIGHSSASFEDAMAGIDAGCSHMTHFFNGMTGLNHRDPGCVGAGFSSDIFVEMITDTIHIHPGLFEFVIRAKGPDRVVLITDCMEAGGLEDGEYSLGGQKVIVAGGAARLVDGTLAGSIHSLIKAVENVKGHTTLSLDQVVRMASLTPATAIGVEDVKGSLEEGKDADIVIFDESFHVIQTLVAGECKYQA